MYGYVLQLCVVYGIERALSLVFFVGYYGHYSVYLVNSFAKVLLFSEIAKSKKIE